MFLNKKKRCEVEVNYLLKSAEDMNSRFNDQILSFCKPLFECFNLKHFWFYRLTDDGYFTFGNSYAEWNEFFCAQNYWLTYPHICHPKFHKSGIYLHKQVQEPSLEQIWRSGIDRFQIGQSLAIVNKIPGGIEEFGFSSTCSSIHQTNTLLNEVNLFRLFYEKFKSNNPKVFLRFDDNKVNIGNLLGDNFSINKLPINSFSNRERVLKLLDPDLNSHLSTREVEVYRLLLFGCSAGKIATNLGLSKRTVEHHIERMKEKLRCYSKVELIQKGIELEKLGSFI